MGGTRVFDRHPKKAVVAAAVVCLLVAVALAEIALRTFFPTSITVAGFAHSANGALYGWGFDPGQVIRRQDPDTGAVFHDRANSRGWRDKERTLDNPDGAYRIVVLGDSNTFGYIVPAEQVYTRVLEERLRAEGINAEVINIALPAWGTDQAFEALRLEGMRYRPDLVIMQFTWNDVDEILRYRDPGKFGRRQPFYYVLGEGGALERRANPRFGDGPVALTRRYLLSTSQVLMRLWHVRDAVKAWRSPRYTLGRSQRIKIGHALGGRATPAVMADLERLSGRGLKADEIVAVLARHGLAQFEEVVLRCAENRPINEHWPIDAYAHEVEPEADAWPLFFSLLEAAARLAREHGAGFVVFSEHEVGRYHWERSWHQIAPGEERKAGFLSVTARIRDFAAAHDIGFIDNVHEHVRARNDHHPNREGNAAMAENVYLYLQHKHAAALDRHRPAQNQRSAAAAARGHSEGE